MQQVRPSSSPSLVTKMSLCASSVPRNLGCMTSAFPGNSTLFLSWIFSKLKVRRAVNSESEFYLRFHDLCFALIWPSLLSACADGIPLLSNLTRYESFLCFPLEQESHGAYCMCRGHSAGQHLLGIQPSHIVLMFHPWTQNRIFVEAVQLLGIWWDLAFASFFCCAHKQESHAARLSARAEAG